MGTSGRKVSAIVSDNMKEIGVVGKTSISDIMNQAENRNILYPAPAKKKASVKKPAAKKPAAKKKPIKHPYAMGDPKGFASAFGVKQQKGTEGLLSMLGDVEPSLVNKIMGNVDYPLEATSPNYWKLDNEEGKLYVKREKEKENLIAELKKKYPKRKDLVAAYVKRTPNKDRSFQEKWAQKQNMKVIYSHLASLMLANSPIQREHRRVADLARKMYRELDAKHQ